MGRRQSPHSPAAVATGRGRRSSTAAASANAESTPAAASKRKSAAAPAAGSSSRKKSSTRAPPVDVFDFNEPDHEPVIPPASAAAAAAPVVPKRTPAKSRPLSGGSHSPAARIASAAKTTAAGKNTRSSAGHDESGGAFETPARKQTVRPTVTPIRVGTHTTPAASRKSVGTGRTPVIPRLSAAGIMPPAFTEESASTASRRVARTSTAPVRVYSPVGMMDDEEEARISPTDVWKALLRKPDVGRTIAAPAEERMWQPMESEAATPSRAAPRRKKRALSPSSAAVVAAVAEGVEALATPSKHRAKKARRESVAPATDSRRSSRHANEPRKSLKEASTDDESEDRSEAEVEKVVRTPRAPRSAAISRPRKIAAAVAAAVEDVTMESELVDNDRMARAKAFFEELDSQTMRDVAEIAAPRRAFR